MLAGAYPVSQLTSEYLPFFLPFSDFLTWLTGMALTLMVFKARWVATFDDQRYLARNENSGLRLHRSNTKTGATRMSNYTAPIRDMQFVMRELAGLKGQASRLRGKYRRILLTRFR